MAADKERKPLGRPLKGKERRFQVGVYLSAYITDRIDAYVAERQISERGYSRSDFINEAVEKHMTDIGLTERSKDEDENTG